MKLIKFDPSNKHGVISNIAEYQRQETNTITVTHTQQGTDGTYYHWLKSYGLIDWYIASDEAVIDVTALQ